MSVAVGSVGLPGKSSGIQLICGLIDCTMLPSVRLFETPNNTVTFCPVGTESGAAYKPNLRALSLGDTTLKLAVLPLSVIILRVYDEVFFAVKAKFCPSFVNESPGLMISFKV